MLILTDTQKCSLAVEPRNSKGNLAPVDGVPQWSSSNPAVADVQPSADGLTAVVVAGATGSTQISATVDADLGTGVRSINAVLDVTVAASEAVTLGISAGVPEAQ